MRQLFFAVLLLMSIPGLLAAQTASTQTGSDHRAIGYIFAGPGAASGNSNTYLNFGGGGEGLIKGGFSVGGELAGFTQARDFDRGFGILSANAGYHFLKASKSGKVVPFASGGYTLFFRSGVDNGVNFGGGVDYWFKPRVGLRFEVRDHIPVPSNVHFVGFRVGLTFR